VTEPVKHYWARRNGSTGSAPGRQRCAVNRLTATSRLHGPNERITAFEALRTVTLGAAETLDLQDLVSSISPGKYADFPVALPSTASLEAELVAFSSPEGLG